MHRRQSADENPPNSKGSQLPFWTCNSSNRLDIDKVAALIRQKKIQTSFINRSRVLWNFVAILAVFGEVIP